jgi:hypothetical protein
LSGLFTLSIEQRPDSSIPVCRLIIRQRADRSKHLCILRLLISSSRATPFAKTRVKLRARDAERIGYDLHSEPSSGNDGKREISFFMSNLHGLSENLVLQGLLAQDSLEFPDALLMSFDL